MTVIYNGRPVCLYQIEGWAIAALPHCRLKVKQREK